MSTTLIETKSTITRNSSNREALIAMCDRARMGGGYFTIIERWTNNDWWTDFVIYVPVTVA